MENTSKKKNFPRLDLGFIQPNQTPAIPHFTISTHILSVVFLHSHGLSLCSPHPSILFPRNHPHKPPSPLHLSSLSPLSLPLANEIHLLPTWHLIPCIRTQVEDQGIILPFDFQDEEIEKQRGDQERALGCHCPTRTRCGGNSGGSGSDWSGIHTCYIYY